MKARSLQLARYAAPSKNAGPPGPWPSKSACSVWRKSAERELSARTVGPSGRCPTRAWRTFMQQWPGATGPSNGHLDEAASCAQQPFRTRWDVETLLETDEALSFRRPGISLEVVRSCGGAGTGASRPRSTCTG